MRSLLIGLVLVIGVARSITVQGNVGIPPIKQHLDGKNIGDSDEFCVNDYNDFVKGVRSPNFAAPIKKWTFCANEGANCALGAGAKIVAYGQGCENYHYVVKSGTVACNNNLAYSKDPKLFFTKACYYTTANFQTVAFENWLIYNPFVVDVLVRYTAGASIFYAPLSPGSILRCSSQQFTNGVAPVNANNRCAITLLPFKCPQSL